MTAGATIDVDALERRLARLDGVRGAVGRLAQLGPTSEILAQAPVEAARALRLDRVLLSRIDDGALVAESLHVSGVPAAADATLARLRATPIPISYPLVEGEILRRRRPALVVRAPGDPPGRHAHADLIGWEVYVVAPVQLEQRVVGFLHGDRAPDAEPLEPGDGDALAEFATGFELVFERAELRRRLRVQHQEVRRLAQWTDDRTSELSDRAVTLGSAGDGSAGGTDDGGRAAVGHADSGLRDLLTRREVEVLELMVRGETNGAIGRALVVSEGTVKYHVKNILRKLHASNRAEATSRYLRLTLRRESN